MLQNVQGEPSSSNGFGRSMYQPNEFVGEGKHVVNFTIASQAMENIESMDNSLEGTGLSRVYTTVQNTFKKRKLSQDSPLVKNEPGELSLFLGFLSLLILFIYSKCGTLYHGSDEPFGTFRFPNRRRLWSCFRKLSVRIALPVHQIQSFPAV